MKIYTLNGKLWYYCPGCQHSHMVTIDGTAPPGQNWSWNGDKEVPHLEPSIRSYSSEHRYKDDEGTERFKPAVTHCHHFLHGGKLNFLGDSEAHQLRGVHELPHFPEGYSIGDFRMPKPDDNGAN